MISHLRPGFALGLLSLLALARILPAQEAELRFASGTGPGATLLFPYFEVDLAAPEGRTTLVSIGNATDEPVLANVVVWTNCGLPVLDFTIYLTGKALQPLSLRDVLRGKIPLTGPADASNPFPSCTSPFLDGPQLDEAALASLQARLLGQPDPADDQCYGVALESPRLAAGYLTVDVLNDCSDTIGTPEDDGYFASGGTGLASNANALWGDFFLVDGDSGSAQGFEAVAVIADANREEGVTGHFYGPGDDRLPLGTQYRTRFLGGGGFDGGTELIVWIDPSSGLPKPSPSPCSDTCSRSFQPFLQASAYDQRGLTDLGSESFISRMSSFRLEVGSEDLPIPARNGVLDLETFLYCGVCSPPLGPAQGWILPIYRAGKFSVGLNAVQLDARGQ